jgi:hypothetical protein
LPSPWIPESAIGATKQYAPTKVIVADCSTASRLRSTDAGRIGVYEGREVLLDIPFVDEEINEAEYRGKKVNLNKPFRTPSGPRKFAVYTKNDKGNVVKVGFGQPGMRVNNADPKKARSFRKRMRCDNPGPKWKAKYWACNVARYRKLLGIKSSNPW